MRASVRIILLGILAILPLGSINALKKHRKKTKARVTTLAPSHAETIITNAYKDISGHGICSEECSKISEAGSSAVYGEILFKSLQTLIDDLKLTKKDTFYDFGSGVGKTCAHVAMVTPATAIGIELSHTRVVGANKAKEKLCKDHHLSFLAKKLTFIEQDFSMVSLGKRPVVYLCSTCYPEKLMKELTDKFLSYPKKIRVLSLKALPGQTPFKIYTLPMTWSSGSTVNYYEFKNGKAKKPNIQEFKK